jgi:hypothetical protein
MSTIIAARFRQQEQVQAAIAGLQDAGFDEASISSFYVNPPGQHDRYPLGGDHDKSEGAENTDKGLLAGGAAGAAVGLAAVPIIGPVGAFVGAYLGTLVGSLASTKEKDEVEGPGENPPHEHPSGMMVAVALAPAATTQQRAHVLEIFTASGGYDAEVAEGKIEAGDWVDFDPLDTPHRLQGSN